jgi:hypothetical protein
MVNGAKPCHHGRAKKVNYCGDWLNSTEEMATYGVFRGLRTTTREIAWIHWRKSCAMDIRQQPMLGAKQCTVNQIQPTKVGFPLDPLGNDA